MNYVTKTDNIKEESYKLVSIIPMSGLVGYKIRSDGNVLDQKDFEKIVSDLENKLETPIEKSILHEKLVTAFESIKN
ncbi:MAG: hypothetical protein GON13_02635 [Nanoarchaeota archaeon]|nr:hypothetical protein [Nanoarchaeota archaeon]